MRLRSSRWTASVLALGMSAASAIAQPPSAPVATPAPPEASAYPQEGLNYSFDEGSEFYDGLDLSPQFRFQAEWIYYTRENRAKSVPLFTGPESVNQDDADFSYQSGYRLNLAFMNDDYELEGSFLELDGLNSSLSGTLTNAVVFDGLSTFLTASDVTRGMLGALDGSTVNFLEPTTTFAPINAAANHGSGVAAENENTELEFLDPGATFVSKYTSSLQDFDINLKGRRQPGRLLRFGFGYRNIQFHEGGFAALRGSFNTADTDGDETPGFNDPNDGLSNAALTAVPGAGLTLASGAGGFFENALPILPDQLLFTSSSNTTNQLNGVQATLDATFLESQYFSLGAYGKAGVYHNAARGSVIETYRDLQNGMSTYTRGFSDSKDRVAFAGNVGVLGTVLLRENLRVFGGYELFFLSGVALAPDQANGIKTNIGDVTSLTLQTHGQALFHGGRVGIEILFP